MSYELKRELLDKALNLVPVAEALPTNRPATGR
jgi:hypothetical protein